MVKGNPAGYSEIVSEYGEKIKMNAEYLIPGTYLFGVQKKGMTFMCTLIQSQQEQKHFSQI